MTVVAHATTDRDWSTVDRPSNTELAEIARRARWLVVKSVSDSKAGHIGAPLSMMDVVVALYFGELQIRPDEPDWPDRDRFILSKGHASIGLYTVMALRGYFPVEELATFDKGDSRLQGHPDVTRLPGLEASTGSLGQGLSMGIGVALGARQQDRDFHTWVLLGDGEIQEGMVWEAARVASHYKLSNLTAIVDHNGLQQFGSPADDTSRETDRGDRRDPWSGLNIGAIFAAFGWRVFEFDGHDFDAIFDAYALARTPDPEGRPTALIAETMKGKGFSLSEGSFRWHTIVPTDEELAVAHAELNAEGKSQ